MKATDLWFIRGLAGEDEPFGASGRYRFAWEELDEAHEAGTELRAGVLKSQNLMAVTTCEAVEVLRLFGRLDASD